MGAKMMNDDNKEMVLVGIIGIMFLLASVLAVFSLVGYADNPERGLSSIMPASSSFSSGEEGWRGLQAVVKGSIYSTGEQMSVFATCTDMYGVPAAGSVGYLSAWYPNGTQYIFNDSMLNISVGYFVWQGYMSAVPGTYLTEFTCVAGGQVAKAQGEWQNPVWVDRINTVLDSVNRTDLAIRDINGTVIGINATVEDIYGLLQQMNLNMSNLTLSGNVSVDLSGLSQSINETYTLLNTTNYNVLVNGQMINETSNNVLLLQSSLNETYILVNNTFVLMDQTYQLVNATNVNVLAINQSVADLSSQLNSNITQMMSMIQGLNLSVDLTSIENMIANLSASTNQGFSDTWQNMNFIYQNLTESLNQTNQLILQTQIIANQSVDRNDSYLVQLIMQLINQTSTPVLGNLTVEEYDVGLPKYWRDWTIKVRVYNDAGQQLQSPEVACTIETTQHPISYMEAEGEHFTKTLFITQYGDFTWDVNCFYT